jgi:DNA-binding NtrC family response regulator
LPALRERKEDILLLTNYFLSRKNLVIDNNAMQLLQQHEWRGNIRELKNVLERASILTETNTILSKHLPFEIQNNKENVSNSLSLSSVEKNHIQRVLQHTNGNKTKTAELLNIGLTTLYRKIEEYHIQV